MNKSSEKRLHLQSRDTGGKFIDMTISQVDDMATRVFLRLGEAEINLEISNEEFRELISAIYGYF